MNKVFILVATILLVAASVQAAPKPTASEEQLTPLNTRPGFKKLKPAPAEPATASSSADPDKKTARLWKAKCASCHGADGKGATDQGRKMGIGDFTTVSWQKESNDAKIKEGIVKGVKREKNGRKQEMDAYGKDLNPDQINAMVNYIRTLRK